MNPATPLRIITVGHVDHGKSTLLGRLLYDTNSLSEEQRALLHAASKAEQENILQREQAALTLDPTRSTTTTASEEHALEFAFILDAFLEEQAHNITIDITQIPFRTATQSYVMIDAPGHKEFLKNMVTGASTADAALLLISVVHGLQDQTCRHLQLLKLLGVHQIIVAINKMDLVHFSQEAFETIATATKELFRSFQLPEPFIIPIAARLGENVTTVSNQMPWYQGAPLLAALNHFKTRPTLEEGPLRFVVQDVYHFGERPLIVGRIESGALHVGEEIVFWPSGYAAPVRSLEEWKAPSPPTKAIAGQSIAITLEKLSDVHRGSIASTKHDPPLQRTTIKVRLFWLESTPLPLQQEVTVQLGTQCVQGCITSIIRIIDAVTITAIQEPRTCINQHEVADVFFELEQPLIHDYYEEIPATGRLVVAFQKRLGGGGIILHDVT